MLLCEGVEEITLSAKHLHIAIVINTLLGVLQPECPQIGTIVRLGEWQHIQNQSARIIRVIVLSFTLAQK